MRGAPVRASFDLYRFAAPPGEIARLQRKFVPVFHGAPGPVLDLGCGRGLFLELLQKAGVEGVGVDQSSRAVEEAVARGFTVEQADAMTFLDHCHAVGRRFGGIFCSHVIEHHDGPEAMDLVDRMAAALLPSGALVLVTPNPANLQVIGESFWLDPTHRRPYPAGLLRQLVEEAGLRVEHVGDDPDTRPSARQVGLLRYWAARLVLGRAYAGGLDLYAVARKPECE